MRARGVRAAGEGGGGGQTSGVSCFTCGVVVVVFFPGLLAVAGDGAPSPVPRLYSQALRPWCAQ